MKLKTCLVFLFFLFAFEKALLSSPNVINYYSSRYLSNNRWVYKDLITESKARKQLIYYKLYYNSKGSLSKVEFPYYKKDNADNLLKGRSIESYDKDRRIIKRENYIEGNRVGYFLFKYTKKGLLKKEEYYVERDISYYRKKALISKHQVKLKYYFLYHYKKGRLIKRTCYTGKEPIGTWLYYNKSGRLIKKDKYTLNDNSIGILSLRTLFSYYHFGKLRSEKSYVDGKPFGIWYFYNKLGKLIRKEFYNETLIYYYKYHYNKDNKLIKALFYQKNRIKEASYYDKGKLTKKELYYYLNEKSKRPEYKKITLYNEKGKIIKDTLDKK